MTAKEVIALLRARFAAPEWAFATELSLVPGFADRRADAVAMNCWTSGKYGCALFGFEVKVSRSDFLHEIKRPEKRAQTYAGVDGLFLVVPAGLVKPAEVPADMGIIWCRDSGAKIFRMPDPCVLPVKACQRPHEDGYPVRELHNMPPLQRAIAVSVLRAFDPSRNQRDFGIEIERLKEQNRRLKQKIRASVEYGLTITGMP